MGARQSKPEEATVHVNQSAEPVAAIQVNLDATCQALGTIGILMWGYLSSAMRLRVEQFGAGLLETLAKVIEDASGAGIQL